MRVPSGLNATLRTRCPGLRVRTSRPVLASHTLSALSRLPEARSRPSGLKATQVTASVCPLRDSTSRASAGAQILTVSSSLPEARSLPSRLYATHRTPPSCPFNVRLSGPLSAAQTLIVAPPNETIRVPSGLNLALYEPVLRVSLRWPVLASHSLSVPSALPSRIRRPSGLKVGLLTPVTWLFRIGKDSVSRPVSASQTFTGLSPPPQTTRLLSGLNATLGAHRARARTDHFSSPVFASHT